MVRKSRILLVVVLVSAISFSACAQAGDPGDVVEKYLAALVAKDDIQAVNLSCAAWELDAKAEGAAFQGVEVTLDSAACSAIEEDGETATVACTGKIVFSYAGSEDQEMGLEVRSYLVALEDGGWKMCGYQ